MNKPEQLQAITSRILQNLKNLQGRFFFLIACYLSDSLFLSLSLFFLFSFFLSLSLLPPPAPLTPTHTCTRRLTHISLP